MHWAIKYIGVKWSEQMDCLGWFRTISKEQFSREIPVCNIDFSNHLRSTIKVMRGDIAEIFGYRQTLFPVEGDAAFLSQRTTPHHIGMVIFLDKKMHIMHVLEGCGMVVSDVDDLANNGWKLVSFWTPCD